MKKKRRPGEGSKVAGAGWTIPAKEVHHWWPKALSKLWVDENGEVSRLSYMGAVLQSNPQNFGAISNAHFMKFDGPWNGTIEPIFNFVDSNLPALVSRISATLFATPEDVTTARIQRFSLSGDERDILVEGLASLVVRSPAFRERVRSSTNHFRGRFGLPDIGRRDNLIAGNIHQWYPNAVADFKRAYFALLHTNKAEFVLGEGYLNNLSGPTFTSNLRAVVPLTPQLAILSFSGSGRTPRADTCAIQLTNTEIVAINDLAQIYTKDFIYFRSLKPRVTMAFEQNEFLEIPRDETVEQIISEMRNANLNA